MVAYMFKSPWYYRGAVPKNNDTRECFLLVLMQQNSMVFVQSFVR